MSVAFGWRHSRMPPRRGRARSFRLDRWRGTGTRLHSRGHPRGFVRPLAILHRRHAARRNETPQLGDSGQTAPRLLKPIFKNGAHPRLPCRRNQFAVRSPVLNQPAKGRIDPHRLINRDSPLETNASTAVAPMSRTESVPIARLQPDGGQIGRIRSRRAYAGGAVPQHQPLSKASE